MCISTVHGAHAVKKDSYRLLSMWRMYLLFHFKKDTFSNKEYSFFSVRKDR